MFRRLPPCAISGDCQDSLIRDLYSAPDAASCGAPIGLMSLRICSSPPNVHPSGRLSTTIESHVPYNRVEAFCITNGMACPAFVTSRLRSHWRRSSSLHSQASGSVLQALLFAHGIDRDPQLILSTHGPLSAGSVKCGSRGMPAMPPTRLFFAGPYLSPRDSHCDLQCR